MIPQQAQFERWFRAIRSDIYTFCKLMSFEPTWQQKQLLDAVQRGDTKVAVRSGQGPGKTTCSAIIGLYRLITRPGAKLLVTAPTMAQCKDVWLGECLRLLSRADPFLRKCYNITNTSIGLFGQKPNQWGALLKTSTKSETAQGHHAEDMDVICEEASGVPRDIIEQYKGTLSNPSALFLQIGNPNTRNCAFFDSFLSPDWTKLVWNAEETPKSRWFDPQRNKDLEKEYGRESNVYRVRVLGEFPLIDDDCIISEEDLRKCTDPALKLRMATRPDEHSGIVAKQIGTDYARYGGDENCNIARQGTAMIDMWCRHCDPSEAFDKSIVLQHDRRWSDNEVMFVSDASGMGQGMQHRYQLAGKRCYEFHNHGTAYRSDKFDDAITEAYFHIRDLIRAQNCYIFDDPQLRRQLTTRLYKTTPKGKIKIESKEEYRRRPENENASPDKADALVMCFYPYAQVKSRVAKAS